MDDVEQKEQDDKVNSLEQENAALQREVEDRNNVLEEIKSLIRKYV